MATRRYVTKVAVSDLQLSCARRRRSPSTSGSGLPRVEVARTGRSTRWGYAHYFVPVFSVLFAVAWLSALAGFHTRSPRIIGTGVEEYRRVVAASCWTFGAIAIVTLLIKSRYRTRLPCGGVPGRDLSDWCSAAGRGGNPLRAFGPRRLSDRRYWPLGRPTRSRTLSAELVSKSSTTVMTSSALASRATGPPRGEHLDS